MSLKLFSCLFVLVLAAIACEGQSNPYLRNPYYRDLYYRNRDLYNLRRYYDGFYKKYNPYIAAAQARIVEQNNDVNYGAGTYSYSYETENGIHGEEKGVPVNIGNQEKEEQVEGAYSFITPEGLRVGVKYLADANGFRPVITYDGVNSAFYASQPAAANVVYTKH
ncbi:endocuticle structural glycoprotein SgAbd-9 [Drosophila kikkawai]|uniref:Endocuticle structural glycoprotein SgAbd-9 n=1 Tax=Drosophila kikkawai TaxID=30033 RepID=A0A6P4IWX2_DROKI|nr:endocuticle structural glycoprotein SgAbd-9 [Drosophila kikkawai]